jgi:hypothetical protein
MPVHTYTERLRIKADVRKRDGHRCTVCGMTNDEHLATYGRCSWHRCPTRANKEQDDHDRLRA